MIDPYIIDDYNSWLELFDNQPILQYEIFKSAIDDYKNYLINASNNYKEGYNYRDINEHFLIKLNKDILIITTK